MRWQEWMNLLSPICYGLSLQNKHRKPYDNSLIPGAFSSLFLADFGKNSKRTVLLKHSFGVRWSWNIYKCQPVTKESNKSNSNAVAVQKELFLLCCTGSIQHYKRLHTLNSSALTVYSLDFSNSERVQEIKRVTNTKQEKIQKNPSSKTKEVTTDLRET